MNLVVNARDAMPRGGRLVISTANLALESPFVERELAIPPGRYATMKVVDNGCGNGRGDPVPDLRAVLHNEGEGKGTGLGLAMVYGIVKQSDGYIRVQSAPGLGHPLPCTCRKPQGRM